MTDTHGADEEEDLEAIKQGETKSYTAILVRQGTHRFYTFTMFAHVLAQTCTVDARHEDPIKGFQRRLDLRRARDIARYIDIGYGTIPGSIILSAQPEADFIYNRPKRTVSFKLIPRAFLILDGQHRVYGFTLAKSRLRVPVVIYNDLSKSDEVRLFRDINTNQRPVPNELLLDINRLAQAETEDQAVLHDVFDLFDKETSSPLFGLMSPSEKSQGRISRVTFNAAVRPIIEIFESSSAKQIYLTLSAYFYAWRSALRDYGPDTLITNPILFRAITLLFRVVAGKVYDRYEANYSVDNFMKIMDPMFNKLKKSDLIKSGASHIDISNNLRKKLDAGFSISKSQ